MDNVVVKFHVKFYFCLILAEGRANCSFQYLREANVRMANQYNLMHAIYW